MATRVDVSTVNVGRLARAETVRAELHRRAELVARAARAGLRADQAARIEVSSEVGRSRARASVFWTGGLAHEVRSRTLGRAIDAARGVGVEIVHEGP